jgi:hypothetical protein
MNNGLFCMLDNEILFRKDINASEKIICGLAKSFNELGLYMTNRQIGEVLNLKTRMVSILISRLVERGILNSTGDGNLRRIRYSTAQDIAQGNSDVTAQDITGGVANNCAGGSNILRENIATSCAHNIKKDKSNTNKGKFVPPTLEEIKQYIADNPELANVEPLGFLKYFTDGDWVDSKGNKVRNWKQKFRTWSSHRRDGFSRKTGNLAAVSYKPPAPVILCDKCNTRMVDGACPKCIAENPYTGPSFKDIVKGKHVVGDV